MMEKRTSRESATVMICALTFMLVGAFIGSCFTMCAYRTKEPPKGFEKVVEAEHSYLQEKVKD